MPSLLLRHVRPLQFRTRTELGRLRAAGAVPASAHPSTTELGRNPVDLRIVNGVVTELGPHLEHRGEALLDAEGALVIPGLWDAHAHLDLEAARRARLDTTATRCAEEALQLVAQAMAALPPQAALPTVQGFGHRLANWPRVPTVAELDAVTGEVPTVLISGDVHSGWLNSAALRLLGLPTATVQDPGAPMREDPWFAVLDRLDEIPGTRQLRESGYARLLPDLLARGLTGVTDMAWSDGPEDWPRRLESMQAQGTRPAVLPRIRVAVYRDKLERWITSGLRTGDTLPGSPAQGIITQGPLKVIADGSMGTASAHMCEPYPAALGTDHPYGVVNISRDELTELMQHAHQAGYEAAIHAIGDAAVEDVAAAFAASGAKGRLEHAQLLPRDSQRPGSALSTLVSCGVELSVQPAHLIDDWQAVGRVWPGLEQRTYAFADMLRGGALLALGSDAPVAPLDPWLAMSAAVGRSTPDGQVWSLDQRLTPEEALAASVNGAGPVGVGSGSDLVLLNTDPLGLEAPELAQLRPAATIVAGEVAYLS
ncbi:N-substituted formamide deformylase precursor [Actinomyces bovis]|uniref:N-substituted formamide deformylase n=1 Tax=Actinomyces bovis TaxID=1658 RepID=A0ABY1VK08_9ACTO|nr:amidohydrolase family protein [Actinomyces bovis]SPT52443.1 N-substituted formamide deformylase precursor [Actinomyces bovis]VEG54096.1 N-substituted formamide deformylase precursor [Actinomyces israelii]